MALALFSGTTYQSPVTSTGAVNAGGKVYFYEPGTSTPKDAYTTSGLTVATANPLILDAKGRGTAWLNGSYKIRVTDSADNLIDEEDNYNKGSSFDITAVTAARTMVGVDDTGSFTHSGTYTVSLTQASTLGSGWFTKHHNIGTGVVTVARLAAGDTINGSAANFTLQPGESVEVKTNPGTTGFVVELIKPDLYATASGTDTYTCTFAPPISALYSGQKLRVRFTNANTSTTPTLNANSIGAKTIKKEGSAALVAGDIPAGHEAELTYNGTDLLLGNPKHVPAIRAEASSSATTVDCGTVVSGDRILFSFYESLTTPSGSGTAQKVYTFGKSSGTATIELMNGATSVDSSVYVDTALADLGHANIHLIFKVTGSGTLVIGQTAGVTSVTGTVAGVTATNTSCHGLVLRNNNG